MNAPFAAADADAGTEIPIERRLRVPRSALIMGLIALAVAVAGIAWLTAPRSSESTDNAYLHADSSAVAPKVGGLVTAVLVKENQVVHAGDPLVRIDTQDYDAKVQAAEAALADAEAGVATAKASLAALAVGLSASMSSAPAAFSHAAPSLQSFSISAGMPSRRYSLGMPIFMPFTDLPIAAS